MAWLLVFFVIWGCEWEEEEDDVVGVEEKKGREGTEGSKYWILFGIRVGCCSVEVDINTVVEEKAYQISHLLPVVTE